MSTLFGGQQLTQPSLFNTSFNSASIQQQQQQQQQNQQNQQPQQPQQPQQQQTQQIQQQQPQLFNTQQYYQQQQQQQQPLWLQNQKKRTIPNHLVPKRNKVSN